MSSQRSKSAMSFPRSQLRRDEKLRWTHWDLVARTSDWLRYFRSLRNSRGHMSSHGLGSKTGHGLNLAKTSKKVWIAQKFGNKKTVVGTIVFPKKWKYIHLVAGSYLGILKISTSVKLHTKELSLYCGGGNHIYDHLKRRSKLWFCPFLTVTDPQDFISLYTVYTIHCTKKWVQSGQLWKIIFLNFVSKIFVFDKCKILISCIFLAVTNQIANRLH